jgi:cytochrome c-type biogenesis protein CcmF
MPLFGQALQGIALLLIAATVGALATAHLANRRARRRGGADAASGADAAGKRGGAGGGAGGGAAGGAGGKRYEQRWVSIAYLLTIGVALVLTLACGLLVVCFFTGDVSIDYVVRHRSDAGWLFKLAGLWAGRQGSLLFWAWLIAVFAAVIAFAHRREREPLTSGALLVSELVLAAFMLVLIFSNSNNPFIALDPQYLTADGQLVQAASAWGMNLLLEHWAMAIHPPTLFVGYAGMTIPFAYAISALICGDASKRWVELSSRALIISWLFLGLGIGLGAIWAYVVLGWGGYWGWDPVENASLLPWLLGVALLHSFTVYRRRGAFKRWALLCATLAFCFVILGTFITRSGIVNSVHAFAGDPVSHLLFLALIAIALLAGIIGLALRWKLFADGSNGTKGAAAAAEASGGGGESSVGAGGGGMGSGGGESGGGMGSGESGGGMESLASKEAVYYLNNFIMVFSAVLLTYMTLSSALPDWLPYGGQKLASGSYDAIARPLGIIYCLLLAICPLLSWGKSDKSQLRRKLLPGLLVAAVFMAFFVWLFATGWLPNYTAMLSAGGTNAETLARAGAPWYHHGLALLACLAAALIIGNTVMLFVRGVRARRQSTHEGALVALVGLFRHATVQTGGYLAHLGIGIMLAGLVGSSMYVLDTSAALAPHKGASMQAGDYTLIVEDSMPKEYLNGDTELYLSIDVYTRGERYIGTLKPGMYTAVATMQTKQIAAVLSLPLRDIFVVFNGVDGDGRLVLDVKINPMISWVWGGFALCMLGALCASLARRSQKRAALKPGT